MKLYNERFFGSKFLASISQRLGLVIFIISTLAAATSISVEESKKEELQTPAINLVGLSAPMKFKGLRRSRLKQQKTGWTQSSSKHPVPNLGKSTAKSTQRSDDGSEFDWVDDKELREWYQQYTKRVKHCQNVPGLGHNYERAPQTYYQGAYQSMQGSEHEVAHHMQNQLYVGHAATSQEAHNAAYFADDKPFPSTCLNEMFWNPSRNFRNPTVPLKESSLALSLKTLVAQSYTQPRSDYLREMRNTLKKTYMRRRTAAEIREYLDQVSQGYEQNFSLMLPRYVQGQFVHTAAPQVVYNSHAVGPSSMPLEFYHASTAQGDALKSLNTDQAAVLPQGRCLNLALW